MMYEYCYSIKSQAPFMQMLIVFRFVFNVQQTLLKLLAIYSLTYKGFMLLL